MASSIDRLFEQVRHQLGNLRFTRAIDAVTRTNAASERRCESSVHQSCNYVMSRARPECGPCTAPGSTANGLLDTPEARGAGGDPRVAPSDRCDLPVDGQQVLPAGGQQRLAQSRPAATHRGQAAARRHRWNRHSPALEGRGTRVIGCALGDCVRSLGARAALRPR